MENTRLVTGQGESWQSETQAKAVAEDTGAVARGKFVAFGVPWEMQADDMAAFHMMLDRLPPGATPTSSKSLARTYRFRTLAPTVAENEASFLLLADGRPIIRSSEPEDIAQAFEDDIKWLVAERSPRKVFLRAGVVGWRDRAIVIPGGTRSGKSTLVRALVGCGATYYSDEYAVLEGSTVQPFPSRIHNFATPGNSLGYWLDEVGSAQAQNPVPVGIILFAPYQSGAVFKPKLISRGKALLGMFKHAVAAQRNPEQVLKALESVTRRCNALEGVRGDAQAVATYLLDRLV